MFHHRQSVLLRKKDSCVDLAANRVGKCGRKRKTSPRTDRKIVQMALKGIRTSCRNFSTGGKNVIFCYSIQLLCIKELKIIHLAIQFDCGAQKSSSY